MRKSLKFLHTLSAMGMTGALVTHLVLLIHWGEPQSLDDYVLLRQAIERIATWVLLPSLIVVLISGLLAIAANTHYQNAVWAWFKALLGILVFEGTLFGIQGPAESAVKLTEAVQQNLSERAALDAMIRHEWGALWIILGLMVVNVVLAIWRPRLTWRVK